MRRLTISILVIMVMMTFLAGLGPPVRAQSDNPQEAALFVAARYDKIYDAPNQRPSLSVGVATRFLGPIWAFPSFDLGDDQTSLNIELGKIYSIGSEGWFAVVGGPNVDWQDISSWSLADQIQAYITGGVGGILGWNFSPKFGVSGFGKYNFRFDEEAQEYFRSGWTAALAVHYLIPSG